MQRVVRACQLNFFRWLQFSYSIFLLRLERKHVACLMDQGELWNCNMLTSFICFPCCVLPVRKTNPNTRGLVWDLQTCWSCVVHTCIFINDNAWSKHESTAKQKRWYHSTAFQHEALFASSTESGACLVHRHLGSFRGQVPDIADLPDLPDFSEEEALWSWKNLEMNALKLMTQSIVRESSKWPRPPGPKLRSFTKLTFESARKEEKLLFKLKWRHHSH